MEPITQKKSNTKTISINWFLILNVLVKDKKEAKLLLPIQNMESNGHLKKQEQNTVNAVVTKTKSRVRKIIRINYQKQFVLSNKLVAYFLFIGYHIK